ncbi:MAG: DNRLRE domain-containing protein [Cyclobacteriaceae bacterium]|nr:DNRLRE domain-containing protein [Cyclobacteriaceae bacterium HetDA_MAG_MS6]
MISITSAQTSLPPSDDTYVRGGSNSGTNFGTDTLLWSKLAGGEASTRRTFLKFDLTSLTSSVTSAILKMTVDTVNNGPDNYYAVFISDDSWTESTLTWDNEPTAGDTLAIVAGPEDGRGQTVSFDLTNAVAQEKAGDGTLSVSIISNGTANMRFFSKEGNGAAPVIEVTSESSEPSLLTDDTYVRGGSNSATNYGTDTLLWSKLAGGEASTRRAFLKFDLSNVTENIESVILKMTVDTVNNGPDNYYAVFIADDSWTESTLTWDNEPASGDTLATVVGPDDGRGQVVSFDITDAIIQEKAGDGVLSVSIISDGAANMRFFSKEGSGEAPTLDITETTSGGPLTPSDDAFVKGGGDSANNFGTDTLLWVKQAGGEASTRRAFLKFDVSKIATEVGVATLKLTVDTVNNGPNNYYAVFISDDSWTESTITWDNEPAAGDTLAIVAGPDDGRGQVVSFEITDAVIQEKAGDGILSISIIADGTANMRFQSKESPRPGPMIEISEDVPPVTFDNPDFSTLMGSSDFNDGLADINAYNAAEAIQAAGLTYTRIGITPNLYLQGETPKPESIDSIIFLLYQEGIVPMLLVEHNPDNGALGSETKWFNIGAAFAERFKPNSSFLTSNGIQDWGITQYSAINEPLFGNVTNFPVAEYIAATKGFADGVHSVDTALQVAPGGLQEVPLFLRTNPYMDDLAALFNDGTLNALDVHRYYDRGNAFNLQFKDKSHQALIDSLKKWHGITEDFRVWSTEYNARGTGNDDDNAKDFVTGTWDLLTVKGSDGKFVSDFALTFRTYLPVSSNENLGMAVSLFPFLGNAKGIAHQMLANITEGLHLASGDETTGVDVLEGENKKMWVWHNRDQWSSMAGTSFTINSIPSYAKVLEVYRYNSWVALEGSTGTPAPFRSLDVDGLNSIQIDNLPTGETIMFLAKENASVNGMPTVSISSPDASGDFTEGDTISIAASASDADGIKEVVLYAGPVRLGKVTTAPYTLDWENAPAGTTTLIAIAKDSNGEIRMAKKDVLVKHPDNGINLIASADTYVKGGQTADDNFGSSADLLIKTAASENLRRRIFLQFKVDTIDVVQEAILRLRVGRSGSTEHTVYYVPDDSWTETGITWNNQPQFTTAITSENVASEGQWTDFDITSQVLAEQGGDGILSLVVWTSSTALVEYFSKEALPGNEPRLLVTTGGILSPLVSFTFPNDSSQYEIGEKIVAKVDATTADEATIDKVEFFIGDSLISTDTSAPYSVETTREEGGAFTLRAVATDSDGKESQASLDLFVSFGGITISPIADTYVRGGNNAGVNFGSDPTIFAKRGGGLGFPLAEPATREAYFKFDLSSIDEEVTSADLQVFFERNDGGDIPELSINAYHVQDDSWEESVITWDTKPISRDDLLASDSLDNYSDGEVPLPVGSAIKFDVTSAVIAEKAAGNDTLTIVLISFSNRNVEFASKENINTGNAPLLILNAGSGSDEEVVQCEGDDCTADEKIDYFITGRYGDNTTTAGTWEAAIWDQNDDNETIAAEDEFTWTNGQAASFSLDYDKSTGEVTYILGDKTLTWQHVPNLSQHALIAFADATGNGNEAYITDLQVNGAEYADTYAVEGTAGLRIPISSPAESGVTVSGKATLTWVEGALEDTPSFSIFVADSTDQSPLGTSAWVLNDLTVYPNPVGSTSVITFSLDKATIVSLQVFDVQGRMVSNFEYQASKPGHQIRSWSEVTGNRSLENGMYFVKISFDGGNASQRILIKK